MKYLLILLLSLNGCTTLKDVTTTAAQIDSGEAIQVVTSESMKDSEKAIIIHAEGRYSAFIEKWKHKNVFDNKSEFLQDYAFLKKAYLDVKDIVGRYKDSYSTDKWAKLSTYDSAAEAFDKLVTSATRTENFYEGSKKAISFAIMTLNIARELK